MDYKVVSTIDWGWASMKSEWLRNGGDEPGTLTWNWQEDEEQNEEKGKWLESSKKMECEVKYER
jgi:hypothetical protein